jgi:hypothetical protein
MTEQTVLIVYVDGSTEWNTPTEAKRICSDPRLAGYVFDVRSADTPTQARLRGSLEIAARRWRPEYRRHEDEQ